MRSLVLSFLIAGVAAPALAGGGPPSLTGTWEGSVSCKTEDANGKGSFKVDVELLIEQVGPGGPLVINVVSDSSRPYSGSIIPSAVKAGEGAGAMIACGTSDDPTNGLFNDIETFHYKVGLDGSGSIKSSGTVTTNGSEVDVCKGSFTRTSPGLVKVVGCPPPV